MYGIHHKERWHSNGCLLYFRGGHHGKFVSSRVTPIPLGVLHYSATESIVLFPTTDDLKPASHGIVEVMELHDEAITVKAMAPLEAHVSAYTMVWHAKPSKGEGGPHTPPQQTHPGGETPHCLHAELGDLNDHELHQLMADLIQEIAQCELTVPPATPSK